jgi:subtilisin-like proprotein convertase family protein
LADTQNITFIEHVLLTVTLTHDKRGHVRITLQSPAGTVSEMAPVRPNDDSYFWPTEGFRFMSVRHWGERHVDGPWTITVDDEYPDTRGRFVWNGFALDVMGY